MSDCHVSIRACVQEILPYQPGKPAEEVERELGIRHAVKLASNENPLGPSPLALQAIRAAARGVNIYPDGRCFHLRRALARKLRRDPEGILIGNGSNELLVRIGQALLEPGDEVLSSHMSFVVYGTVAQLMGARFTAVPLRDQVFDLEAMARALTPKTRLVFIANPNNPTGTTVDPRALRDFVARVPAGCLVVLDEAYVEYADPKTMPDSLSWVDTHRNVVVLRTFSKAYGLAGLRVGYGAAHPKIVGAVDRVREPFNVNSLAQAGALAALDDREHLRRSVSLARRERRRLAREFARRGFEVTPSQANFLFLRVPDGDGRGFCEALMRRGVILRPITGPYVRATLGTERENQVLVRAVDALAAVGLTNPKHRRVS